MRAAVYCRISDDRAGAGLGVARQETDCRALCDRLGWDVAEVYVDNDLSAYSGKPRPSYKRMLTDVRSGDVDAIVAWHPDRLHRSTRELEDFIDLVEASGVTVETVQAGPYDLTTAAGRAVARTLGAWARYESEHKADRSRRKARELAEAGKLSGGGPRPYGYEADYRTVNPDEAVIIQEVATRLLAGETLWGLARELDRRGVKPSAADHWHPQTLRRLMTSWRIAGIREHKGEPVADAEWPAIVDRATVERLRAVLRDPARKTVTSNARAYPLRGVLFCAACDTPMISRRRMGTERRYICDSRDMGVHRTVAADYVEDHVLDLMVAAFDERLAAAHVRLIEVNADYEAVFKQLQADEAEQAALAVARYVDKTITPAQFAAANDMLKQRVETFRARLHRFDSVRTLTTVSGGVEGLRARWASGDVTFQATIVRAMFVRLDLGKGRRGARFDPDRVQPVWR